MIQQQNAHLIYIGSPVEEGIISTTAAPSENCNTPWCLACTQPVIYHGRTTKYGTKLDGQSRASSPSGKLQRLVPCLSLLAITKTNNTGINIRPPNDGEAQIQLF
jgi:hypothetical protein